MSKKKKIKSKKLYNWRVGVCHYWSISETITVLTAQPNESKYYMRKASAVSYVNKQLPHPFKAFYITRVDNKKGKIV